MLSLEEILQISNDMGVTIIDNTEDKHYILDEYGEKIEFSVDMLMNREENISSRVEVEIHMDDMNVKYTSSYNLVSCDNPYVSKSAGISKSIIDAA